MFLCVLKIWFYVKYKLVVWRKNNALPLFLNVRIWIQSKPFKQCPVEKLRNFFAYMATKLTNSLIVHKIIEYKSLRSGTFLFFVWLLYLISFILIRQSNLFFAHKPERGAKHAQHFFPMRLCAKCSQVYQSVGSRHIKFEAKSSVWKEFNMSTKNLEPYDLTIHLVSYYTNSPPILVFTNMAVNWTCFPIFQYFEL